MGKEKFVTPDVPSERKLMMEFCVPELGFELTVIGLAEFTTA
jgi:hypothetical protein